MRRVRRVQRFPSEENPRGEPGNVLFPKGTKVWEHAGPHAELRYEESLNPLTEDGSLQQVVRLSTGNEDSATQSWLSYDNAVVHIFTEGGRVVSVTVCIR